MKKLIKLIFGTCAILIMCCSCDNAQTETISELDNSNLVLSSDGFYVKFKVIKFTYKEHEYISFKYFKEYSVVHNPDCKYCKKDTINN